MPCSAKGRSHAGRRTGDGNPIGVDFTSQLVVDGRGDVLFTSQATNRVWRIDTGGRLTVEAGNGTPGFSGDGRRPADATLLMPMGLLSIQTERFSFQTRETTAFGRSLGSEPIRAELACALQPRTTLGYTPHETFRAYTLASCESLASVENPAPTTYGDRDF